MQLARVVGEVVATSKDASLSGIKMLVVQPVAVSGEDTGRALVALDSIGAGVGEHVFFVRGREPPADATVIGIVDHWSVG